MKPGQLLDGDEDKKSKREKILEAAYIVFTQKGFHKATIDEIIALADTGKGTVYNYFTNKEHLFFTLLEERGQISRAKLAQAAQTERKPLQKLEEMVRVQLQFFAANTRLWQIMMHELRPLSDCNTSPHKDEVADKCKARLDERVGLFEQAIKEGQAVGEIKYPDANRAASMLFSIMIGTAMGTGGQFDVEDRVKSITELFFYGVAR